MNLFSLKSIPVLCPTWKEVKQCLVKKKPFAFGPDLKEIELAVYNFDTKGFICIADALRLPSSLEKLIVTGLHLVGVTFLHEC